MGYAYYDTPLGPAGYSVDDICHEPECAEEIDRGLESLCGGTPGSADEFGCGHWFCGNHLTIGLSESIQILGGGLCSRCATAWDEANPEIVAADEAEWQRRCFSFDAQVGGS